MAPAIAANSKETVVSQLRDGIGYLGFSTAPSYNQAAQLGWLDVPLRIHHPNSDKSVHIAWTKALLPQLKQAGVAVEYLIIREITTISQSIKAKSSKVI